MKTNSSPYVAEFAVAVTSATALTLFVVVLSMYNRKQNNLLKSRKTNFILHSTSLFSC
jgi:hypothetical protein